ncbi:MAG: hypothetical protein KDI65_10900 [Alphaproteobacteria bacterium]|nr:hypothetical protein [Alphaproteobacteria bacterium]
MAAFESNIQRDGFNSNVAVVEFQGFPNGTREHEIDGHPIQVFGTQPVHPEILYDMGIPAPAIALDFQFNVNDLRDLQAIDQSGRTGQGMVDSVGHYINVIRNDSQGITIGSTYTLENGTRLAAQVTIKSDDINRSIERLQTMEATPLQPDHRPDTQIAPPPRPPGAV